MKFRAKVFTFGVTKKSTPANGLTTKCTAMATLSGPMESSIKVNSRKIRGTAKEDLSGETTESTMAVGIVESRAELDIILTNTGSREKVSGLTEDANVG